MEKDGGFNPADGRFHWSVRVNLPASADLQAEWGIREIAVIVSPEHAETDIPEPAFSVITNLTVTVPDNEVYRICPVSEADETTEFAYLTVNTEEGNGFEIIPLMRCICSDGECTAQYRDSGFCSAWRLTDDAVICLNYARDGFDLIDERGGEMYTYSSRTEICSYAGTDTEETVLNRAEANVMVPSVFRLEYTALPDAENKYTASLMLTINEDCLDLSSEQELKAELRLSDTLVYLPGTLAVTEMQTGRALTPQDEYTITWLEEEHRIEIVIRNPGNGVYSVVCDAQIDIPDGSIDSELSAYVPGTASSGEPQSVEYSAAASVNMFGNVFTKNDEIRTVEDYVESETVRLIQIVLTEGESGEGKPLANAEFGLYGENGELIVSGITDENGTLTLTHESLQTHVLYYIQEIKAPAGYRIDTSRKMLCFCEAETCEECDVLSAENEDLHRITGEDTSLIELVNYYQGQYRLPATGGSGTLLYILWGSVLTAVPLVYGCIRKQRPERRNHE